MRHLVALLMLCVMLLSHGSMGEAVPHAEDRGLAHVDAHSDHGLTAHHAGTLDLAGVGDSDDDRSDDPSSHVLHAHVVGHLDRAVELDAAPVTGSGPKLAVTSVQDRPSRDVAPLLEPPAA